MTIIQAVVLGLIQGLTEFLPVSSSGHLIIVPRIFSWSAQPLAFDIMLHIGTAMSLVWFFRSDLLMMIKSVLSDMRSKSTQFAAYSQSSILAGVLMLTTLPASLLGLLLDEFFEEAFRTAEYVVLFLFFGTVLMLVAQKFSPRLNKYSFPSSFPWATNRVLKSLGLGLFQSLALLPGFSRSGASISGGLLLGLDYATAAKVSFLMSLPIILMSGLYKIPGSLGELSQIQPLVLLSGLLASFLSGLLAVSLLTSILKRRDLTVFIIYRLVLVGFLLVFLF